MLALSRLRNESIHFYDDDVLIITMTLIGMKLPGSVHVTVVSTSGNYEMWLQKGHVVHLTANIAVQYFKFRSRNGGASIYFNIHAPRTIRIERDDIIVTVPQNEIPTAV